LRLETDIAIIGAGAAGLTAAIFAREAAPDARILLLEAAPRIGAKILISGGGRCNVTNERVTAADFNGNRNAIAKVLRTFTVEETIEWFASLGVQLQIEETKKLFPVTNRARTVVDALLRACQGADIILKARVTAIRKGTDFEIDAGETFHARRVILCAGGRSVPKTGSDGSGYALAKSLGHSISETFPALVPLVLEKNHWLTTLSGTSAMVELTVRTGTGRVLESTRGSMLCTHFGLSGPATLDISRHWIAAVRGDPAVTLAINFLPDVSLASLEAAVIAEAGRNPHLSAASFLRQRIPERIAMQIAGEAGELGRLARDERRRILHQVLHTVAPVLRDRGFDYAEVTAGGVPLSEVNLPSMASRVMNGMFLCGEILDVDGRIGGFNFQWAWASGRAAGIAAARSLHTEP
jgi:predicted Rossmann fold flavoprotein